MGSTGIDTVFYIASKSEREKFKELYNKFTEQYSIKLSGKTNDLIVTNSSNENGIDIRPSDGKVINSISALKPASELEIKLIKNNLVSGFSVFETKDKETIVVTYKG